MKRVEIMIADDDADVRETFKDLIVDYKRDLSKHRRDDHLGILFNDDYKIYYDEAENGLELEQKIAARLKEHPSQYFVSFVDEDMPVKRGTDAIAGITELLYTINRKFSPVGKPGPDRPKVKLVSYTQKQDIDISEGIAKDSGASLFLRKTGLDDFYEEMIRIIEHLVLDLTNLEYFAPSNVNRTIEIRPIIGDSGATFSCFKEYLKFRYRKEVLTGGIPEEYFNNAWMYPDFGDFFSIPIGVYAKLTETPKLVACARLVLPGMQNESTSMMEELLDNCAGSLPGLKGDFRKPSDNSARLDKYYIDRSFIGYDIAGKLLKYLIAYTGKLDYSLLRWDLEGDLFPIAEKFGFKQADLSSSGKVSAELNLNIHDAAKFGTGEIIERLQDNSDTIELKLIPTSN